MTTKFWITKPIILMPTRSSPLLGGDLLYKQQMDDIANHVLLSDTPLNKFNTNAAQCVANFKWINKGELVAGSSLLTIINNNINSEDVDIYVKSVDDATDLLKANGVNWKLDPTKICTNFTVHGDVRVNVIWGIKYDSVESLLGGFDIRACAVAYDPATDTITHVDGAVEDAANLRIVFQTNARAVTVFRLLKYVAKGFTIDRYQRAAFAELIKIGKHSNELELTTGYAGEGK